MSVVKSLVSIMNKSSRPKPRITPNPPASSAPTDEAQLRRAVEAFKRSCEFRRFRSGKLNYKRHVSLLAAAKQPSLIEHVLEHQKKYPDIRNEGFAIRLIELYGNSGMFDNARKLFDELPELNCDRTVKSFNALLGAAAAARKFDALVEAFNDLPARVSVEPDLISYNTVIHALCETGSLDAALSMLDQLESTGKGPNVVTFNTLLNAFYKDGRFAEGERIWATMATKKVVPDVRSYNSRLRGLLSNGKVSEATSLVAEMENGGIKCDSFTYNALIKGLCSNGRFEEAKKWHDEARKRDCAPKLVSSYLMVVRACLESNDLGKAFEICCDATQHGLSVDANVIEQVVARLVEKRMTEEATKLEGLVKTCK